MPTQIVTEYVRHVLLDHDGTPVRGIRYRSAARAGGISWVLFFDAGGCTEADRGWDDTQDHWLEMDPSSLQRFQPAWADEAA